MRLWEVDLVQQPLNLHHPALEVLAPRQLSLPAAALAALDRPQPRRLQVIFLSSICVGVSPLLFASSLLAGGFGSFGSSATTQPAGGGFGGFGASTTPSAGGFGASTGGFGELLCLSIYTLPSVLLSHVLS